MKTGFSMKALLLATCGIIAINSANAQNAGGGPGSGTGGCADCGGSGGRDGAINSNLRNAISGYSVAGNFTSSSTTTDLLIKGSGIINWNEFSINAGEKITFQMDGNYNAVVNRVLGVKGTYINGSLAQIGSGTIAILNPNGIVVGASGSVDVNKLHLSNAANITTYRNENGAYSGVYFDRDTSSVAIKIAGTVNAPGGISIAKSHSDGNYLNVISGLYNDMKSGNYNAPSIIVYENGLVKAPYSIYENAYISSYKFGIINNRLFSTPIEYNALYGTGNAQGRDRWVNPNAEAILSGRFVSDTTTSINGVISASYMEVLWKPDNAQLPMATNFVGMPYAEYAAGSTNFQLNLTTYNLSDQLRYKYANATPDQIFDGILKGELMPAKDGLRWAELYNNGKATDAQVQAYEMWLEYIEAKKSLDNARSNGITNIALYMDDGSVVVIEGIDIANQAIIELIKGNRSKRRLNEFLQANYEFSQTLVDNVLLAGDIATAFIPSPGKAKIAFQVIEEGADFVSSLKSKLVGVVKKSDSKEATVIEREMKTATENVNSRGINNSPLFEKATFDQAKLNDHFARHGADFNAKTVSEYQAMAKNFIAGPLGPNTLEKYRADGDLVRYNTLTQEFAIMSPTGTIRTYYKPQPIKGHPYSNNLDYYNAQE